MSAAEVVDDWRRLNRTYLTRVFAELKTILRAYAAKGKPETESGKKTQDAGKETQDASSSEQIRARMPAPPAIDMIAEQFELTPFERSTLLLCAGIELDSDIEHLVRLIQPERPVARISFGLALAVLPGGYWQAINSGAPLRHWRLVEMEAGAALIHRSLSIDERILSYLLGLNVQDERLYRYVGALSNPRDLSDSQRELACRIAETWKQQADEDELALLQINGHSKARHAVAARIAAELGREALLLDVMRLPAASEDLYPVLRLLQRETLLRDLVLLLDCDSVEREDLMHQRSLRLLAELIDAPILALAHERIPPLRRSTLSYEVEMPSYAEQVCHWAHFEEERTPERGVTKAEFERLASEFDLDFADIRTSYQVVRSEANAAGAEAAPTLETLRQCCRQQTRPRLEHLAQRIVTQTGPDDLILPPETWETLQEILVHVRQQHRVHHTWEFGGVNARGLGITALFSGASGTGKTLAAEMIANALARDLYRIDLSTVISKYIGETEKNLDQIFRAAEGGSVVLLFDEADALFGKRTEVKESHDRYANIEVSYLLQRMEAYRGLAILTTNLSDALDQAFLRRLRFVVEFPFPDEEQRHRIWQRVFPPRMPLAGIDPAKLARLNIAGGAIRNIALHAAFEAADRGETVSMAHLLTAARREFRKNKQLLVTRDVEDWLE